MSNVYARVVDLAGGSGGGGGALVVATRSDTDNPAVFADFAALETYTGTATGTADANRINVTDANLAQETFAVGTLDGNNQVTAINAAYIRVNNAWVAVATNLVGTPGSPGQDGQADLSGIVNGRVPYNNNGTLDTSLIRVLPSGEVFLAGTPQIESGTLAVGPFIQLSERGGFLGLINSTADEFTFVDFRTLRSEPSRRPRILELLEAESLKDIQLVATETLTSPLTFSYTPTTLSRVNAFVFRAIGTITNLRFRIRSLRPQDNLAIYKYWPSEADWLDDTGGNFDAGDMTLDLEASELPLSPNTELEVTIRFDSGGLAGDTNGIPYIQVISQLGQFADMAFLREIVQADWDETDTDSNAFILNKPTIPTDTNDFVDTLTTGIAGQDLTITLGRTGTLPDLSQTVTLPEGEQNVQADWDETDTNSDAFIQNKPTIPTDTNDFVDTAALSVSGQDLTITLGRTGALADLVSTVTLPEGGTTPTASVHGFSLNIPQNVETDTVLTQTPTVTYSVANHAQVQTLTVNIDGTAYTLTTPTRDGEQSEVVTLNQAIPTDTARTVTNTLTGVNTDNGALNILNYDLTIAAPVAVPDVFYGLSTSDNPATVDTATLTSATRTDPITISTGVSSANDYFILLVPNDDDVTSITDTVLSQDVTDIFVRTADVRTIGPITYNSYVIGPLNSGVDEQYVVRF